MTDAHPNTHERLWDLIDKIPIAMLVTEEGGKIVARPMAARPKREENAVYFLIEAQASADRDVAAHPAVCITFADPGGSKYVSLTGPGEVSNDREKIKALWNLGAKAWWDSPEDPVIRVLKVTPEEGQYWDGPTRAVSTLKMLAAAVGGSRPELGSNEKVQM